MLGRSRAVYLAVAIPAIAWGALPSPGRERLLASGPGDQTEPSISGQYVAFTDQAPGPGAWKVGIFNYGTGTIQAIPGGTGSRHEPNVAGQIVAFTEMASGYGQIWIYDLIGGALQKISPTAADQRHPAVGQDTVFWEDARAGGNDIWFLNLVTGDSHALPLKGVRPRASGKRVVFLDPGANPAVRLSDLSVTPPASILIHKGPAGSADIEGNNVALSVDVGPGPPSPPNYDILVYSVTGQFVASLALPGNQVNPHISGNWVAFEDQSLSGPSKASRVVLWDYTSKPRVLLAPPAGTSLQTLSDIDYPRAVYADDRSGNLDVYSYDPTDTTGPPPPPPPPPPDGGCRPECDDDEDECDDDHRDGGREEDGDRGRRDGGHDDGDCDDDHTHHRDAGPDECDEGEVLADLTVEGRTGEPAAGDARFRASAGDRLSICIDAREVSSAWVTVNDRVVAGPRSFGRPGVRLVRRTAAPDGVGRVGATVAGQPAGSVRVRVLRSPSAGVTAERAGAQRNGAPEGQGCGTGAGGGVALGALLATVAWRRRRPR